MLKTLGQVAPRYAQKFNFQYTTCHSRVAKCTQHVAPNNVTICCAESWECFARALESNQTIDCFLSFTVKSNYMLIGNPGSLCACHRT